MESDAKLSAIRMDRLWEYAPTRRLNVNKESRGPEGRMYLSWSVTANRPQVNVCVGPTRLIPILPYIRRF